MKRLLLFICVALLIGCSGEATLSTASHQKFKRSVDKMHMSLPAEKQRQMQQAMATVKLKQMYQATKAGNMPASPNEKEVHQFFKPLHGMTADQIIAYGKKLQNQASGMEKTMIDGMRKSMERVQEAK